MRVFLPAWICTVCKDETHVCMRRQLYHGCSTPLAFCLWRSVLRGFSCCMYASRKISWTLYANLVFCDHFCAYPVTCHRFEVAWTHILTHRLSARLQMCSLLDRGCIMFDQISERASNLTTLQANSLLRTKACLSWPVANCAQFENKCAQLQGADRPAYLLGRR